MRFSRRIPNPVPALSQLPGFARVFVVAPHPDDDVIGCGGTIALLRRRGVQVDIAYVTDGSASHIGSPSYPPSRIAQLRENEALQAAKKLGVERERLHFLREKDSGLSLEGPALDRLIRRLGDLISALKPTTILSPWVRDIHSDHVVVARALRRILRTYPGTLLEYHVWPARDGEDFIGPAKSLQKVDVQAHRRQKAAALSEHRSQLGEIILDANHAFTLPVELQARAHDVCEYFHVVPRSGLKRF